MTDSELHGILALPPAILTSIMVFISVSACYRDTSSPLEIKVPPDFAQLYRVRKWSSRSPFAIRRVCKAFNAAMTPFLFHYLHIRATPNGMGIYPPLLELVSTSTARAGRVFQEHTRTLKLSLAFLDQAPLFWDDQVSEPDPHMRALWDELLPTLLSPAPLSKTQKLDLFKNARLEAHQLLPDVIKALKHVTNIEYDVFPGPASEPSWLRTLHAHAFSTIPQIHSLQLATPWVNGFTPSKKPDPRRLFEGLSSTIALHIQQNHLHTLHFAFRADSFPDDLDDLWRILNQTICASESESSAAATTSSPIALRSITLPAAAISSAYFTFLASFSGLETLIHTRLEEFAKAGSVVKNNAFLDHRALSSFFFNTVLKHHCKTLHRLRLPCFDTQTDPQGNWSIRNASPDVLRQCVNLEMLATIFHPEVTPERESAETVRRLEELLGFVQCLLSLQQLYTVWTGLEPVPLQLNVHAHIHGALTTLSVPPDSVRPPTIGILALHWYYTAAVLLYRAESEGSSLGTNHSARLRYQTTDYRINQDSLNRGRA